MSKLKPLLLSGLIVLPLLAGATAQAQSEFDLSLEQAARPRAERDEAAIALVSPDFPFVAPGKFTVAVVPGEPPIVAYATGSTEVVVGGDPDLSQLLADALGLELDSCRWPGRTGRWGWFRASSMPSSTTSR